MDYCQHLVRDGSSKMFSQVKGQLILLNFPKEASTRRKLMAFLYQTEVSPVVSPLKSGGAHEGKGEEYAYADCF